MAAFRPTATLLLLALAGCASAPSLAPAPPTPTKRLNDWRVWSAPRDAAALRAQLAPYAKTPACFDARLSDALDAAHVAFLREADPVWRGLLAAGFARRGEPAYAASAQVATRAGAEHATARAALASAVLAISSDPTAAVEQATALEQTFTDLGDALFASEAGLVRVVASLHTKQPVGAWPTPRCRAQRVALTFLQLSRELATHHTVAPLSFRHAAQGALETGHLTVLHRLETLREVAVGDAGVGDPSFPRRWTRGLATAHLRRNQPLPALRFAMAAERLGAKTEARLRSADRLLRARASFLAGRRESALEEAQQAADLAHDKSPQAEAEALAFLGEVLLAFKKLDNAAGAFQKAHQLFDRDGRALSAARQQLNLVVAWLRAGDLGEAEAALRKLEPRALAGEGSIDLRVRVQVVGALFRLVARKRGPQDAIHTIETALDSAREAGAYQVVETYRGLVETLRQRRPRRG